MKEEEGRKLQWKGIINVRDSRNIERGGKINIFKQSGSYICQIL
jgi:hypothetical protein